MRRAWGSKPTNKAGTSAPLCGRQPRVPEPPTEGNAAKGKLQQDQQDLLGQQKFRAEEIVSLIKDKAKIAKQHKVLLEKKARVDLLRFNGQSVVHLLWSI